jgi:hypothetical protein
MVNAANAKYKSGNQFDRVTAPPYYIANQKPFWPSLPWETSITIPADEPLNITRPVVLPEMVPLLFFNSEIDGLIIHTIHVRYTGAQESVNTLFVYEFVDFQQRCLGGINLPVSLDSTPPQPVYLLDTEDEIVVDSFGQPVEITGVMGQGDPLSLPLPPILLGEDTLRYALRLEEGSSIYLGIAQELTTPIVVTARGQRYSKIEKISASLGAE